MSEARRIMEHARQNAVLVRLIGGTAVILRDGSVAHPAFRRTPKDIDLVAGPKHGRKVERMLESIGYVGNPRFNRMNGGQRLLFYDTANGRQVDVFVGSFEMCHKLPIAARLGIDRDTVPLAELLLTKLQIARVNYKDLQDIWALLYSHDVGSADGELVNGSYVSDLLCRDWGLWRTCTATLSMARERLGAVDIPDGDRAVVLARIDALTAMVDLQPKTVKWRVRSQVGDRVRWYQEPEELAAATVT